MKTTVIGFAIAVLIAFVGIGMIAQEANPGDFLYGYKTNINEKLAGLFAITYTAQLDHEVDLLEERLEEINALVALGEMTNEEALIAKTAVIAQLEKTSSLFSEADKKVWGDSAKQRISSSLSRLQVALQSYRSSLTILEEKATLAENTSTGPKRGNGSHKTIAAVVTETVDTIEETVSEVLDETIDIIVDSQETETDMSSSTDETVSNDTDASDENQEVDSEETQNENEVTEDDEVTEEESVEIDASIETELVN